MPETDFIERRGEPGDARQAAALIYQADPAYYDYWFALTPELVLNNLALLWQAPEGSFSHQNHRVWWSGDCLAALAAHYPAQQQATMKQALAAQVDLLPLDASILHRNAAMLAFLFPQLPEQAWYLRALTVNPGMRGHGLGSRILRDVLLQAEAAGCREVHTDVDSGNPGAVRFYSRHGFRVVAETRVLPLQAMDFPLSLRMVYG